MSIVRLTAANIDKAGIVAARLMQERDTLEAETGIRLPFNIGPGAIEAAMRDPNTFIFIASDNDPGVEPQRIVIMAHREGTGAQTKGWMDHVWGPSSRHLGILRFLNQKLVDAGLGTRFAHFPALSTPMIDLAVQKVLPERGDYNLAGTTWTASPTGRVYRVRLSDSLTRLIAAGAPVEAG